MKTCLMCNISFIPRMGNQVYCSDKCAYEQKLIVGKRFRAKNRTKLRIISIVNAEKRGKQESVCEICGKTFNLVGYQAVRPPKCCSLKCKSDLIRAKRLNPSKLLIEKDRIKVELIQKGKSYYALIDLEDLNLVKNRRWHMTTTGYAKNSSLDFLHRIIMNPGKDLEVDHINRDKLDNRRSNLRVCTHTENMQNCYPRTKLS